MIAWPSMRKNANSWLEKNYNVLSPNNVIEFLLGQKAKSFFSPGKLESTRDHIEVVWNASLVFKLSRRLQFASASVSYFVWATYWEFKTYLIQTALLWKQNTTLARYEVVEWSSVSLQTRGPSNPALIAVVVPRLSEFSLILDHAIWSTRIVCFVGALSGFARQSVWANRYDLSRIHMKVSSVPELSLYLDRAGKGDWDDNTRKNLW